MKPRSSEHAVPESGSIRKPRGRFHSTRPFVTIMSRDNGIPYLAMPFLVCESLKAASRRSRLIVTEILSHSGREVADGLGPPCSRTNPSRIKLPHLAGGLGPGLPARVKSSILASGSGRQRSDATPDSDGSVRGTPGYMAPEQAGHEGSDQRLDHVILAASFTHSGHVSLCRSAATM